MSPIWTFGLTPYVKNFIPTADELIYSVLASRDAHLPPHAAFPNLFPRGETHYGRGEQACMSRFIRRLNAVAKRDRPETRCRS